MDKDADLCYFFAQQKELVALTRRGMRRTTLIWSILVTAMMLLIGRPAGAQSKNYYFPEVRIEVQVAKDGSFTVDEFRTFDFRGSFTWANLWIPLRAERKGYVYDAKIDDFRVLDERDEPLRSEVSSNPKTFQAKWYYSARNTQRTFHIHYRLRGGIISYPTVSELYWQIIGSGWEKPTGKVTISVHLPEDVPSKNDLLVYGHGPLSGWVEIVDLRTVRFTASNVHSGQEVEIRVVWPAGMVQGVPSDRQTRASIMAEESGFVQDTIERVRRGQEEKQRRSKRFVAGLSVWSVWLFLGPLLWFFFYIRYWGRVGKDYKFDDIPSYMHEPPSDLSPALVEVLRREGRTITPRSFTATLFDLARKGFLEMEDRLEEKSGFFGPKEEYDTIITCKKDPAGGSALRPYETRPPGISFRRRCRGERGQGSPGPPGRSEKILQKETPSLSDLVSVVGEGDSDRCQGTPVP